MKHPVYTAEQLFARSFKPLSHNRLEAAKGLMWTHLDTEMQFSRVRNHIAIRPWAVTIPTPWPVPDTVALPLHHVGMAAKVEGVPARWGFGLARDGSVGFLTVTFGWQAPGPTTEEERALWTNTRDCKISSWTALDTTTLGTTEWAKALIHIPNLNLSKEALRCLRRLVGEEARRPSFWALVAQQPSTPADFALDIPNQWIGLSLKIPLDSPITLPGNPL